MLLFLGYLYLPVHFVSVTMVSNHVEQLYFTGKFLGNVLIVKFLLVVFTWSHISYKGLVRSLDILNYQISQVVR